MDLNNKILFKNGRIIADASSIIYMDKINILKLYASFKNILVPEPIFEELNGLNHKLDCRNFVEITDSVKFFKNEKDNHFTGLKYPDNTLIDNYYFQNTDGILTDDGMICKYCKKNNIPYINTPMVLFSLKISNIIELDKFNKKLCEVYKVGRYSKFVINYMNVIINRHIVNV